MKNLTTQEIIALGFTPTSEYGEALFINGHKLLIPFGAGYQLACDYGEPGSYQIVVITKEQLEFALQETK